MTYNPVHHLYFSLPLGEAGWLPRIGTVAGCHPSVGSSLPLPTPFTYLLIAIDKCHSPFPINHTRIAYDYYSV